MSLGSNSTTPRELTEEANESLRFGLLGIDISLSSDDPAFFREFEKIFGCESNSDDVSNELRVTLRASSEGVGQMEIVGDQLDDPGDYFLSFSSPTIPIRRIGRTTDGWDRLGLGQDDHETFRFRGNVCEFAKMDRWPRILSHLLFLRLLRLRSDLIFFHAASVEIAGQGVLLIGPKGSGKTTLSLALAARGWALLGDETAAYSPSTGDLVSFPRPVAIKPGPRGAAIEARIQRLGPAPDEDGIFRIPVSDLFSSVPPDRTPLRHMVFLQGFAEAPRMSSIQPGRDELANLQPLAASLVNQSPTQRVFQLIRIMSGVSCWALAPGDPDTTAEIIQQKLEDS